MIERADLSDVVTIYHTKRHHNHKDSNLHSRCRRNFNLARNCIVMCQECAVRYLLLGYVIWRLDMASTGWSEVRILKILSEGEPQEYITCSSRPWPSDMTFVRHLLGLPALAVYHCDSTKNAEVIRMWTPAVSGKPLEMLFNPLNVELNPLCHLLALLGAHHILHVSRIRVNAGLLQEVL